MKLIIALILVLIALQQIERSDGFVIEVDKERLRKFGQDESTFFIFTACKNIGNFTRR